MTYRLSEVNADHSLDPGQVVLWMDGYVFQCPCNERTVYVATPPHEAEFDEDGIFTLKGSCGYKAAGGHDRPENWCHFSIDQGQATMHDDAACPGAQAKEAQ